MFSQFDKIDATTERYITSLVKEAGKASVKLIANLAELISSLEKTSQGNIKASIANLRTLSNFDKLFNKSMSGYYVVAKKYLGTFSENSTLINSYFNELDAGFSEKAIYKEVLNLSISNTNNALINAGINQFFSVPVRNSLNRVVTGALSTQEAIKSITETIKGTGETDRLSRYVSQVAQDAQSVFVGEYVSVVSEDLGLEHYLYRGTKIETSRDICILCQGKYMTKKQVKEVINRFGDWSGKIPGTNESNFIIYRGGYNCRHQMLPVSKTIYDANKDKQLKL